MSCVVCRFEMFEFQHGPSCSELFRMQRESWRSLSPGLRVMPSLYESAVCKTAPDDTGRVNTGFAQVLEAHGPSFLRAEAAVSMVALRMRQTETTGDTPL